MRWFDVLSIGLDLANYAQIRSTKQQISDMQTARAVVALEAEIMKMLRNLVFATNSSAKELAIHQNTEPQKVFVAASLLEWRMKNFGIEQELFVEYSDKEYVDETYRNIRNPKHSSLKLVSPEQSDTAARCFQIILEMPALNSAIEARANLKKKRELQSQLEQLDKEWEPMRRQKSKLQMIGLGLGLLVPSVICIGGGIASNGIEMVFGSATPGGFFYGLGSVIDSTLSIIRFVLYLSFLGVGLYYFLRNPSNKYPDLHSMRQKFQQQIAAIPQGKSAQLENEGLTELLVIKEQRQRFIQNIMGDTDDDYDMVFLKTYAMEEAVAR